MRKIFLSAGHSLGPQGDPGASANGYIEAVLTVKYRQQLAYELEELGICPILDENRNVLAQSLRYFKTLTKPDTIVCDIHYNSGPSTATGTETFIDSKPTVFEIELAHEMSKAVSETLNIPLRGNYKGYKGVRTELESHHKNLAWFDLKAENILLEICFLSNIFDMKSYDANWKELAKKHAKILYKYANK